MNVRRGDVVIVGGDPTRGSKQRGTRPCVVVQNDTGNRNAPTTIVAPCTTQYTPGETYPFEVELTAANTPLAQDSVVDCSQLRVVDTAVRVQSVVGSVPGHRVAALNQALEVSQGV